MLNPEQIQETIGDVQELKEKILKRHQDDLTFCLRTETVFNQYINSLSYITGTLISDNNVTGAFKPQPLKSVIGKPISEKISTKLELPVITTTDEETFKENIQLLHDGFLDRENIKLLESLKEIEIRGVAKVAGLDDYREAKIDGSYVDKIKEKIKSNQNLEAEREKVKQALKNGPETGSDTVKEVIEDQKPIETVTDPVITKENTESNQNLEAEKTLVQEAKTEKGKNPSTQNSKK